MNHGISVREEATSISTPLVALTGIPFVIGAAPVQSAKSPLPAREPVLCTSWADAVEKLGFSDDWEKYNICEVMHSHFVLYERQPAIFCNLLDPVGMSAAVDAADFPVKSNRALLPIEAVDVTLIVKKMGGSGTPLVKGTDYEAYYSGENLIIELLVSGAAYGLEGVNVEYRAVEPESVTSEVVAIGMQNVEKCLTGTGVVPDLILAPGFSCDPVVAAVMATKANGVNGIFGAKALVDISSSADGGAVSYTDAISLKGKNNFADANLIVCWPKLWHGGRAYHTSTQLAGVIATVDAGNGGIPYESPSNKGFKANGMVFASGQEANLTLEQANILNANGILTALNFVNGWVAWGNYTACFPGSNDVKDTFISVSRMFDWVGSTVVRTFWKKLDMPMNSRLRDNIIDTCNIWLNGIVGAGYLLGARVVARDEDNPLADLMAGKIRVRIFITPPLPAQEIEFVLEYDAGFVKLAFAA